MDWTFILLIPALLLSVIASACVNSTFKRFSKKATAYGHTGYSAARLMLDSCGLGDVEIARCKGSMTDHYDPAKRTLFLSETVYAVPSQAAVGVAAHEAGHALQHAQGYKPLQFRMAIVNVTNFGSRLAIPLIVGGLLLTYLSEVFILVAYLGLAFYMLSVIFQLVTLPVEFNASRRAIANLTGQGIIPETEAPGVRKVLSAAAMTYVAALAVSVAQMLRLLLIVSGGRRRR